MICRYCCGELPQSALFCPWCGKSAVEKEKPAHAPKRRGNGQGTVYRRGKSWTAQVTRYFYTDEDGKRHRKLKTKGGFKTKREALEAIPSLFGEKEKQTPTLQDLWTQYRDNEMQSVSSSRQTSYKIARKRLEPVIGFRVDAVTTSILQDLVNEEASSYYTARDMKNLLSKLFNMAMADQYVTINLAQFIVLPPNEEKEPTPFTAEEVQKMWSAYADGDVFVGYLLLMIYSGMMPAELFSCRKGMIDLERCEIYGCGKKTKTRKESPIVFAECVRPVVEELCAYKPDKEELCHLYRTEFYDEYHKTTERLKIRDLPLYSCRHTTGTEAAKQNLSAPIIQKIMRHAKITTSQRYIHLGSEQAHLGINSIAKSQEKSGSND